MKDNLTSFDEETLNKNKKIKSEIVFKSIVLVIWIGIATFRCYTSDDPLDTLLFILYGTLIGLLGCKIIELSEELTKK